MPFTGANLLGRWEHAGDRVNTRVQVYFDRVDRDRPPSGLAFDIDTYDFDLQQSADCRRAGTTSSGDWAGAPTTTTR